MMKLTDEQVKFLEYLRDAHLGMGYTNTIQSILNSKKYNRHQRGALHYISNRFKRLVDITKGEKLRRAYGTPTKYLNR